MPGNTIPCALAEPSLKSGGFVIRRANCDHEELIWNLQADLGSSPTISI
jgi:hypothetical protein